MKNEGKLIWIGKIEEINGIIYISTARRNILTTNITYGLELQLFLLKNCIDKNIVTQSSNRRYLIM